MNFLRHTVGPSQKQKGFTLIELGIVLAVIGILSLTVIQSAAFIEQAKVVKAMHHIVALRDAALNYSADIRNGVDFENLSLNSLVENNYFPGNTKNAWNLTPAFQVSSISGTETTQASFKIAYKLPNTITYTQIRVALEDFYLSDDWSDFWQSPWCMGSLPPLQSNAPCWVGFKYTP